MITFQTLLRTKHRNTWIGQVVSETTSRPASFSTSVVAVFLLHERLMAPVIAAGVGILPGVYITERG